MADPRYRLPLQSSLSFSGIPTSSEFLPRPLKRRFTDDDPFAPPPNPAVSYNTIYNAEKFDPNKKSISARPSLQNIRHHPQGSVAAQHLPTTDPQPTDPGAVFIHPPFNNFPDVHKYKDGLTYNLMADNPEWFLDPTDYITTGTGSKPDAIRYPSQLEPPRGWCPAKKKELKEGWPEGEEPRLRCTFCRRTYAGVNAKSMWRRHVYEKHKIAMANRRDNNERKGRGSNKENKDEEEMSRQERIGRRGSSSHAESTHKSDSEPSSSKQDSTKGELADDDDDGHSQSGHQKSLSRDGEIDLFPVSTSSSTPPLTPGLSPRSSNRRMGKAAFVPESPYDPLLTPSFRHSPARLPIDQPWRFPSPSHPLHSSARELSLCMLVRGEASPMVRGLDVSPLVIVPPSEREKRSIFSSPMVPSESESRPPKRRLFSDTISSTPFFERMKPKVRVAESPLGREFTPLKPKGLESIAKANDAWRVNNAFTPTKSPGLGLLTPFRLDADDPFSSLLSKPWTSTPAKSISALSPPDSIMDPSESPVLRSSQNSAITRNVSECLGLGLLEGFSLRDDGADDISPDDDDLLFVYNGGRAAPRSLVEESPLGQVMGKQVKRSLLTSVSLSFDCKDHDGPGADCDEPESSRPKKRRRTISGLEDASML